MDLKKVVVAARTNKNVQTLEILRNSYMDNHVLCISEASVSFLDDARNMLGEHFMIPSPAMVDTKRDQNSFILLRKDYFGNGKFAEPVDITAQVHKYFATSGMLCADIYSPGVVEHMCSHFCNQQLYDAQYLIDRTKR